MCNIPDLYPFTDTLSEGKNIIFFFLVCLRVFLCAATVEVSSLHHFLSHHFFVSFFSSFPFFPCFQSVVNLISELQEQMCRLQLEINSRIQERKSQDRKPDLTPNGPQSSPRSVVETRSQRNCSRCDVREVHLNRSLCIASSLAETKIC